MGARELPRRLRNGFARWFGRMIIRKSPAELEKMRRSGLLVWQILNDLAVMVKEGVTTHELEVAAEKRIPDRGARPPFQNYYSEPAEPRHPYVLVTSAHLR